MPLTLTAHTVLCKLSLASATRRMVALRLLLLLLLLARRGANPVQPSLRGMYVLCLCSGSQSNASSLSPPPPSDSVVANCSDMSTSGDITPNRSFLVQTGDVNTTKTSMTVDEDDDNYDSDDLDDHVFDASLTVVGNSSAATTPASGSGQRGPESCVAINDTVSSSDNVTIVSSNATTIGNIAANVSINPSPANASQPAPDVSRRQSRSFQKYLNYMMRRGNQSFEKQPHMALSFVNGIYHTEGDWKNISDGLNEMFGIKVKAFYNPSSGWWVSDATKAGLELALKRNDVATAKLLTEHLRAVLRELGPRGRVLHLAHSGGAILTYLAAKHHLTAEEKGRIDVATFGGGKSITRKYFRGRTVNYYSRNDPLLLLDQRAAKLSKLAVGGSPCAEVKDMKHNTTFVYLSPLGNNPLVDHSMGGPTYQWALRMEAVNFKARLIELLARDVMEKDSIRLLRKRAAALTGVHNFWEGPSLLVRRARKVSARITNKRGFFSKKYTTFYNTTNSSSSSTHIIPMLDKGHNDSKNSSKSPVGSKMAVQQQVVLYTNASNEASLAVKFYNAATVNFQERVTYLKERFYHYVDIMNKSAQNISSIGVLFKSIVIGSTGRTKNE